MILPREVDVLELGAPEEGLGVPVVEVRPALAAPPEVVEEGEKQLPHVALPNWEAPPLPPPPPAGDPKSSNSDRFIIFTFSPSNGERK